MKNKETLENYLKNRNIYHEFVEYSDLFKNKLENTIDKNKIAKTIVFVTDRGDPIIVVLRSIYKVHQKKFAKILKVKDLRLANEDEVIKYTGYKIGGVSPFDIDKKIFLDKDLLNENIIYVGGGCKEFLLKVRVEDIIKNNICEIIEIPKKSE